MPTNGKTWITSKVASRGWRGTMPRSNRPTKLRSIWQNMRQRCNNPNASGYKNYGGRGIAVCNEWDSNFAAFRAWALPLLKELSDADRRDVSIDRVNNDGHYGPSNCQLVSRVENLKRRFA